MGRHLWYKILLSVGSTITNCNVVILNKQQEEYKNIRAGFCSRLKKKKKVIIPMTLYVKVCDSHFTQVS